MPAGPTKEVVRLERWGRAALLVIDNPPVNATSREVRAGLLAHLELLAEDRECAAIIVTGAGKSFVAGADIREFGRPLAEPQSPAVIRAMEAAPQPVIAAINGAALGGGLELALGCDYRMAAACAVLGLPEITLGFIPGNGGTQRVARLAGLPAAIDLVTSGRRLGAEEARQLGIVDKVVAGDVVADALSLAARGEVRKRRVRDLELPPASAEAVAAAETAARRKLTAMPWIDEAIEVVRLASTLPIDEALARERAVFERLRLSASALALRHLFFAERAAAKVEGLGAVPRPLRRVAVVGGGLMGSGITYALLTKGLPVTLVERDDAALGSAHQRIESLLRRAVASGRLDPAASTEALSRLSGTTALEAVAEADLVLEAVVEDLALKLELFAALGRLARDGAILASNTSYLDLEALARASGRPADCCGLHFFSPAHIQKLVEVAHTPSTANDVVASGLQLARRLGKTAVVARSAPGLIGNAIFADYRAAVEALVLDGALPAEVDAALEAFGFAMGPFRVFDLAGLDIAWRARQATGAAEKAPSLGDRLCEAGRFGLKTGAGWYRYPDGGRQPEPDPEVHALIERHAEEKGIERRSIPAEAITRRALAAILNRAALLVGAGIARQAGDIDVVMTSGYGFPRAKGGPVHWASRQTPAAIAASIEASCARLSAPRGDLAALLPSFT